MSFISEELIDCIEKFGCKFQLNLSFDTVLEVQNLFKEDLPDTDKIHTAINMLVITSKELRSLTIHQKNELLTEIFNDFITIKSKRISNKAEQKLFDFEEDGEYIYSSFFYDYGLDLIDQQGKLHWKKFIYLFQGLSDHTKIKEIMSIRARNIPKSTKYNQDEIQNLRELKAYYALGQTEENYKGGLNALFSTLEKMATK